MSFTWSSSILSESSQPILLQIYVCVFSAFGFVLFLSGNNGGGGSCTKQLVEARSVSLLLLPWCLQRNRLGECKPLMSLCAWLVIGLNLDPCVCVCVCDYTICGSVWKDLLRYMVSTVKLYLMSPSQMFRPGTLPLTPLHTPTR